MVIEIIFLLTVLLLCVAFSLIVYARWNYGVLEALNIPVVKRTFMLGSTPDMHNKVQHFEDIKRFQELGSVYGVYEGRTPVVYICDPDLIRLVLVKDFDYFHNRRAIDLGDPIVNEMLDFLPVEKWREIRSSMSPIFTSGKLKMMSSSFKETIKTFMTSLEAENSKFSVDGKFKLDIRQKFDGLVMDLICRSAFGIQIGDMMDPNNTFVKLFKDLQGADAEFNFMYTLSMVFPFLTYFAPTLQSDSAGNIVAAVKSVMNARKQSGQRQNDFVDILNDMMDKLPTSDYKRLNISEISILAQAINFVLAGYDAICTTMTFLLYYISKDQEVQERLLEEIDSFIENHDGNIIFEKLNELPYLQACLVETLRLCPPFIRPERVCTKDWEHNGLKIKEGTLVMIPAWAVNRNPEYYPQPELFDPMRFMPENKARLNPYAFVTFGQGPRNCIGMRYAYDAMKLCLCHILKDYKFETCLETKIQYKTGVLFLIMYDPVYLNIAKRV